jgi:hypothetical protein
MFSHLGVFFYHGFQYWKMLKMGLSAGAVKNALVRDGKDPSVIDYDPEKSLKSQTNGLIEEKDDGPPLCEDPEFSKVLFAESRVARS